MLGKLELAVPHCPTLVFVFCILQFKNGRVFVPRFWYTSLSRCVERVLNGLNFGPAGRDHSCAHFFEQITEYLAMIRFCANARQCFCVLNICCVQVASRLRTLHWCTGISKRLRTPIAQ